MASKDFSIVAKVLLNGAGFTTGKDKVTKDAKALERGISASNTAIKDSFSSLTNGVLPQFGSQFGALGGALSGVKGAFKALIPACATVKTAIISTGIGAIIIAITTAVAGLVSWMKRTDEGGDTMRKVFDIIKAVIEVVLTKIASLGSAIVKLFKGDFKGAGEDAKNAFTGWGSAMKENIRTANELNDIQDKLEDYNENYATKRATLEEKISELQLKARDEEAFSATERLAFNEQLKKSKLELFNLEFGQKKLEFDALKKEYDMGAKNQDERTKLNEKEAELIQLRAGYNQGLRETMKLNNKLYDDAQEEIKKEEAFINRSKNKVTTLSISNIKFPSVAHALNAELKKIKPAEIISIPFENLNVADQFAVSWKDALINVGNYAATTANAFMALGDAITSASADGKLSFKEAMKIIIQTATSAIPVLGALAAAQIISKEASKGLVGIFTAIAGLAALGMIWTSFVSPDKYAAGGITKYSGYQLVGENGPELAQLGSGTRIYNNFQTRNMLGGNNNGGRFLIEFKDGALQAKLNYDNRRVNSHK